MPAATTRRRPSKAALLGALEREAIRQAAILMRRANDKGIRLREHISPEITSDGDVTTVTFTVIIQERAWKAPSAPKPQRTRTQKRVAVERSNTLINDVPASGVRQASLWIDMLRWDTARVAGRAIQLWADAGAENIPCVLTPLPRLGARRPVREDDQWFWEPSP